MIGSNLKPYTRFIVTLVNISGQIPSYYGKIGHVYLFTFSWPALYGMFRYANSAVETASLNDKRISE
jgi:hypothetical protein